MTALEIFRLVATEFADMDDETVQKYMELYKDLISERRFGTLYQKALAYLTAHKLKMNGFGDNEGVGAIADSLRVSSYSEGETSISFSTGSALSSGGGADSEYMLTIYGLEYLNIRSRVIIPIISAGEG